MSKIACTHPGKMGDALYALPAVRELCGRRGVKADFYTSEYCQPLTRLLERQSCVDRVVIPSDYQALRFDMGVQPWNMPVPSGYDAVYQMGFRTIPNAPLPDFIAQSIGLPSLLPIVYDFDPEDTLNERYIVIAPRGPTGFSKFFRELAEQSPVTVVEIGGRAEATGAKRSIDLTGTDMLETLPWLSRCAGFVGLMSAMLVLANGFSVPKVSPHDGKSWDLRHAIKSPLHHYPVNPSPAEVLRLLGIVP